MRKCDVFLSYHGERGMKTARELKKRLSDYGVKSYFAGTSRDRIELGAVLPNKLEEKVSCSRYFVPVITREYHLSPLTTAEVEFASNHDCVKIPVYAEPRDSLAWNEKDSERFGALNDRVGLDLVGDDISSVAVKIAEKAGIGVHILSECDSDPKSNDIDGTLKILDELVQKHRPSAMQMAIVFQYRANRLWLAGRLVEAKEEIERAANLLNNKSLLNVISAVCVTKSKLSIDEQNYDEACAVLTEVIMSLGPSDSMIMPGSNPMPRAIRIPILGDMTRELASIYLEKVRKSLYTEDIEVSIKLLDEAWVLYCQSLDMLSIEDQPESVGWVYDSLGDLLRLYAEINPKPITTIHQTPFISTLPEAVQRMRGRPELLYERARKMMSESFKIFSNVDSRLGMGWSQYRQGELELETANRLQTKLRNSERLLTQAMEDFGTVAEGVGLCNERLYWVYTSLGQLDAALECGRFALKYCKPRRYLNDKAIKIENDMKDRGLI